MVDIDNAEFVARSAAPRIITTNTGAQREQKGRPWHGGGRCAAAQQRRQHYAMPITIAVIIIY